MGVSVRMIRAGLLVGAALLLSILVALLVYARFKASHFAANLATRLGVDVKQETNGFTYSQSSKGQTIFTIHASKAVQRQDGKITLHDVAIVLYGRDGSRADRISGDEFEYDQAKGEARGTGEILLDLGAPTPRVKPEGGNPREPPASGRQVNRVLHVKTQGLFFQQKAGLASTDGLVQFTSGGLSGQAIGASYDSQSGRVVLQSAVQMSGTMGSKPGHLTAAHGEYQQQTHRMDLDDATYTSSDQSLTAAKVVVATAGDGTPQTLQAVGKVVLTRGDLRVDTGRMEVVLGEDGKPRTSHLFGNVTLSRPGQAGSAADAHILFDEAGRVSRLLLEGRVLGTSKEPTSTRRVSADRIECTFLPDGPTRSQISRAKATGSATVSEVRREGDTATRELAGDTLDAHFTPVNGKAELSGLTGAGNTILHQISADGTEERSAGDSLDVGFRPGKPLLLTSAVQRGNVKSVRVLGKTKEVQRSTAGQISYDATENTVLLRGRAHVEDAVTALDSETIKVDRVSGETTADGNVRVLYDKPPASGSKQQNSPEPVHVSADRASLRRDEQTAFFYAAAGKTARIWQTGSQVEAPVLELMEGSRRLIAQKQGETPVHALLTGTAGRDGLRKGGPLTVISDRMIYSDVARNIDLTGHVKVDDQDGSMTADHAIVYLADPGQPQTSSAPGMPGGQVQKMVATGAIQVQQPNRRVEGEQLVYTADDRTFVVTGTKSVQPRLVDQARGTVTGTALRFRSGDDSVLVSGNDGTSGAARVRTETRVKK